MTAVASPPSLQPLPRLGWNSGKPNQGVVEPGNGAGEVSRIFGARKSPQRANSASSVSTIISLSSSQNQAASDTSVDDSEINTRNGSGTEQEVRTTTKSGRTLWTPQKSEPTVAASNGRPGAAVPLSSPVQLSERQAQLVGLPTQNKMQQPQQINGRPAPTGQSNADPPAVLILLPMNGTFEKKQITVPYFPDILRIGRQTNPKTAPTPVNGFFDSKVLSRQHAEVWADRTGKIWIRDVKSSNGTFVNGVRLSPESRDSEPHELRDNDMLELGIDIVSEDQKSIVHHKVSAKIEHAGIQTSTSSVLDLNLGDIDPGSGGGILGGMLPQQQVMRGRGGSQSSVASSGRMSLQSVNGVNGVGVQRHMNTWLSPVSIEQVVKRLGNELKQAKLQTQDLHRTSEFFQAVLNTAPGQELPKPPSNALDSKPQTNGISPQKTNIASPPFSQPPAPPPSQPLPEKPDASQQLPFRLVDNSNQSSSSNNLSMKGDAASSQILSLAESLASARKELEQSSGRIQQLEEMLREERRAREQAESHARQLMEKATSPVESAEEPSFTDSEASIQPSDDERDTSDAAETASIASTSSEATLVPEDESTEQTTTSSPDSIAESATSLQERLTLAIAAMEDAKTQMQQYKRRAEAAEEERGSLAEMVARIREEAQLANAAAAAKHGKSGSKSLIRANSSPATSPEKSPAKSPCDTSTDDSKLANGAAIAANGSAHHKHTASRAESAKGMADADADAAAALEQVRLLQGAVASALEQRGDTRLAQAAPYASIVGVVLLGVGIMAFMNGWQKTER